MVGCRILTHVTIHVTESEKYALRRVAISSVRTRMSQDTGHSALRGDPHPTAVRRPLDGFNKTLYTLLFVPKTLSVL